MDWDGKRKATYVYNLLTSDWQWDVLTIELHGQMLHMCTIYPLNDQWDASTINLHGYKCDSEQLYGKK